MNPWLGHFDATPARIIIQPDGHIQWNQSIHRPLGAPAYVILFHDAPRHRLGLRACPKNPRARAELGLKVHISDFYFIDAHVHLAALSLAFPRPHYVGRPGLDQQTRIVWLTLPDAQKGVARALAPGPPPEKTP